MKPTPAGWPRIASSIAYADAVAAIDWLCAAFGFEVRLKVEGEGGHIVHSELTCGDGVIMVCQEDPNSAHPWKRTFRSPRSLGGQTTQSLMMYVDDVEAHCRHARDKGAQIINEPATHDYGDEYWTDRSYGALDLEGHAWWFAQRLRNPPAK